MGPLFPQTPCNFKGARITEQTLEQEEKKLLLFSSKLDFSTASQTQQSFCTEAFSLSSQLFEIIWRLLFLLLFSLPPRASPLHLIQTQAQVELALLSQSVLTSSGMPGATEETGVGLLGAQVLNFRKQPGSASIFLFPLK